MQAMPKWDERTWLQLRGRAQLSPGQVPRAATGCPPHHLPMSPGESPVLHVGPRNLQLPLQGRGIAVLLQCFRTARTELRTGEEQK